MKVSRFMTILVATISFGWFSSAHAETILKIGYTATNDSHYGTAANVFGDELTKRTDGRYKLKQFPSAEFGGEKEMIQAVRVGVLDMVITSTGPVGIFVPETRIFDIPFLFRNYSHARNVLDGPIGQDVLRKFKPKNLVALVWLENGFRHITNNRHPIINPGDLMGMKIRTMENQVHMEAFKAMGVLPAPIPMNELINNIKQGTIDGQENPIPVILSNKLYTVQKNLTLTGHVYSPALLLMSSSTWDKISNSDKKSILAASKIAVVANRKRVNDDENNGIATIKSAGVKVIEKIDSSKFIEAVASAYVIYANEFGADKIRKIKEYR